MNVEISTNSYSEEIKLNCPVCTETVKAEIWLIIDVIERMDLAARILKGSLNSIKCTKCSNEGLFDTPLLLLKSDQRPPLIFCQSSQATEEENRDKAFHLMTILKNRIGKKWNDEWFSEVCVIKHQFLVSVLSEWLNRGISKKSDKQPAPKSKISLELQAIFEELARPTNQSDMEYQAKLCRQALSLIDRKESPELWAKLECGLGDSLAQNSTIHRAESLELSIESYKLALEVFKKEEMPVDWAMTIGSLATVYAERIKGNKAENLELSIKYYNQILEVFTKETMPVDWARTMMNLATVYDERIKGNKAENLKLSIKYSNRALEIFRKATTPINWAMTMGNLASAYVQQIDGERTKNLELSIKCCKQALEVFAKETLPLYWGRTMINLANAYRERIEGEKAKNLEVSIGYCNQALQVFTKKTTPIDWARTMMNLGSAYAQRIKEDRAENLEMSISACNQALQVFTRERMPMYWALTKMNLANAYRERIKEDRAENLEFAITAYEETSEVHTKEAIQFQWALIKTNLANAYKERIKGKKEDNLELAIKCCNQALEVFTKETMPVYWAMTVGNLAGAYAQRIKENRAESLELAIKCCNQALEVFTKETMPMHWAATMSILALAYKIRMVGDKTKNLERAINYYKRSLEIFSPNTVPNDYRRVAIGLANLYFQQNNWHGAAVVYSQAIEAAENLYKASILRYSKEAQLTENRDLYHLAAYSFARIGDLRKAVIILERAKARRLSEVLERERTSLEQIQKEHPNAYKSYQDAVVNLRQLENEELRGDTISLEHKHYLTPDELRAWASKAKGDLDAAIEKINAIAGYEKFLAQPDFDNIENALEPDCPLVYLVTTPAGSLSLIISKSSGQEDSEKISIRPIWSGSFVQSSVTEILDNWFSAYEEIKKVQEETPDEEKEKARKLWLETIEKTTKVLWKQLMGKVTQHLLEIKAQQAVLIPMGHLALLPLHSAWMELDGKCHYALDDIAFTYAPSAVALSHSRQLAEKVSVQKLLAVVEPKPTTATELPNANIETDAVASLFKSPNIFKHEDATRSAVLENLPEADIVHFACHGETNLQEPLKSGLLMAENEMITAGDLFQLGLKGARMATLSACETGIVGVNLPDEAIALPAAFLQAGFAGVVSSLWFVDDLSTAMLMERFYHLWQSEGVPPARALQKAQQWLRDTTNKEKAEHFKRYVPSLSVTRMPKDVANKLYKIFTKNYVQNECSFEHPFYWAAFCLTGI